MTLSIWRYAHLALAIISFLFLSMASITGVILAIDPIVEKTKPYKIDNFNSITLSETIPVLKEKYTELVELSIDNNQFVILEGFDENGDDFKQYINPLTGEKLGKTLEKSEFIEWVTALHRSFFLHETGRFIVGIMSFLLFLISISGFILILKRQKGIRYFFNKLSKDFLAQYIHVATGRILLIPIIIIALTGTYLFLLRFEYIKIPDTQEKEIVALENAEENKKPLKDFEFFKSTKINDVKKIEFPFVEDPEEFYKIKLKDREIVLDQYTGKILSETKYPTIQLLETLSLDLHTGRTNSIWAFILFLASINILVFIYSGFFITYKRLKSKIVKNKYGVDNAEIIIFVGSENGSTQHFANKIHQQLINNGEKSFITILNDYTLYKNAKHFIVFTSTYGLGDAPNNATKFLELIQDIPQNKTIDFSVVGFGSDSYKDFCSFAKNIDIALDKLSWANRLLNIHCINNKNVEEFVSWVKNWSEITKIPLASAPSLYVNKKVKLSTLKVVDITKVSKEDNTFKILFKTNKTFKSGDLLTIYPLNNSIERFYSIAKIDKNLQLVVKLHDFGLGSNYLYQLKQNSVIKASILKNESFHFPKKAKQVALIANGTGIAPFLGMINENKLCINLVLYAGFRSKNNTTQSYQQFIDKSVNNGRIRAAHFAFSREEEKMYVMDLVKRDRDYFTNLLKNGGIIMICGSLAMLQDLEKELNELCISSFNHSLDMFKENNQLLTDCY